MRGGSARSSLAHAGEEVEDASVMIAPAKPSHSRVQSAHTMRELALRQSNRDTESVTCV